MACTLALWWLKFGPTVWGRGGTLSVWECRVIVWWGILICMWDVERVGHIMNVCRVF